MRIAITGASGFLGTALATALSERGDTVVGATRHRSGELRWSVDDGFDPATALSGFDAVIHLAGENIGVRWTDERRASILRSRVEGTRRVVEALRAAERRPRTFLCASAVGYYGETGDREVNEESEAGADYLAEVVRAWETEARAAEELEGVRVIRTRFGIALGRSGGALAKMLPAFKMGVGGRLGDGEQYMAWIHRDDLVRAVAHLLDDPDAAGVYNLTAPHPVDNATFTKALGRALRRPTFIPVPSFAISLLFGEMGETALLQGQRAVPSRLSAAGFRFSYPTIEEAFSDLLG